MLDGWVSYGCLIEQIISWKWINPHKISAISIWSDSVHGQIWLLVITISKKNCGDVHSSNFIVVHDINHSDSTMVQLSIWMPGPRCPHEGKPALAGWQLWRPHFCIFYPHRALSVKISNCNFFILGKFWSDSWVKIQFYDGGEGMSGVIEYFTFSRLVSGHPIARIVVKMLLG